MQTIKIISLNLWGGRFISEAIDFFRDQQPDVILLQEVYDSHTKNLESRYRSLAALKEGINEYFFDYAPTFAGSREGEKLTTGNLIISRWPIVNREVTFYDIPFQEKYDAPNGDHRMDPRNLQHATIQIQSGTYINIFNVHGVWDYNSLDNPRRLLMAETIIKKTAILNNVVVAGDFNIGDNTETIKNISKNLIPVFHNLKSTFNALQKQDPIFQRLAVDKMFISQDLTISSASCPNINISDHLPLVAELRVE